MTSKFRLTAQSQLDKRFNKISRLADLLPPPRGWIKAIREAVGMTTAQFAQRLGVSQPRAVVIEKAEQSGAITLASLAKAANALDCHLAYVLIPRRPLSEIVKERARLKAKEYLASTRHSMALEDQLVDKKSEKQQLEEMVEQLIKKSSSDLWE
jgi:predicted DNA-binding mobile mystery protein A